MECTFEYEEGERPAIGMNGYGSIDKETDFGKWKIAFINCTFGGSCTHPVWSRVSVGQLLLYGCRFEAENGIRLTFSYEIVVRNTGFRLGTNADYAFRFVFAFSDTVRVQGQIRIVDCTVHGDVDNVVQFVKGHRPPTLSERDLMVESVRHVWKIRENAIRSGYRLFAKNNSWNEGEN